jgi:polysaccharide export outer membrane protein
MILLLSSCKVYKQNIILQADNSIDAEAFRAEIALTEGAYVLQANDQISVEVFTNGGERVIDPNFELLEGGAQLNNRPSNVFQIFPNNTVDLPVVGFINIENLTVQSLQEKLALLYKELYINPYVRVKVVNQRVIVLGALGGQVIPITNENTTLLEVLASAGGLTRDSKGSNIRLIRGPFDDPKVQIINLKTIDGMRTANLNILPNDVIYIEPIRRVFTESIRDLAPILGVVTNIVTLLIVVQNFK